MGGAARGVNVGLAWTDLESSGSLRLWLETASLGPEAFAMVPRHKRWKTMRSLGVLVVFVLVANPSCHNPVASKEPRGIPDATILENVEFFRAQAQASHPGSILVAMGGISPLGGTTCPDGYWWYRFAAPPYYELWDWDIACNGQFGLPAQWHDRRFLSLVDIVPLFTVDSTDVIRIARENGGQQYLDKYPDARVSFLGRYFGGRSAWEMTLETRGTECGFRVIVDGQTAEVLFTHQSCP
jgi:hypothetical protein